MRRKIKLYRIFGLSRGMRRIRMRDRIQKKANELSDKGLDSRIPFLKKVFCGQDVEPIKKKSIQSPQFHEGQVFVNCDGFLSILTNNNLTESFAIFNQLNLHSGLQVLPTRVRSSKCYVVVRCNTTLFGDLRISTVSDDFLSKSIGSSNGVYLAGLHQIVMKDNIATVEGIKSGLVHEIEHAAHFTLWGFAGMPWMLAPKVDAEYLSMLAEFLQFGSPDIALFISSKPLIEQSPHQQATGIFREKLSKKYGISLCEIDIGLSLLSCHEGEELTEKGSDLIERLKSAAEHEYARTYEQLFGLSLDDIEEIIDNLPVI